MVKLWVLLYFERVFMWGIIRFHENCKGVDEEEGEEVNPY